MKHTLKESFQEDVRDVSMKMSLEYPNGTAGIGRIVQKAKSFCTWINNFVSENVDNQLDLDFSASVSLHECKIVADRPNASGGTEDYTFRVEAATLSIEERSTIFNLSRTGKRLAVRVYEINDSPVAQEETVDDNA